MREAAFAALLLLSGAAIVYGIALIYEPAAWIAGGLLAAAYGYLVLSE